MNCGPVARCAWRNAFLRYAERSSPLGPVSTAFGGRWVASSDVSVWWHVLGVIIIVAAVLLGAPKLQPTSWVFTHFVNNTGFGFGGAAVYVFLLGLLNAQYTFTGYDASAHMTEETIDAAVAGPKGIVNSIVMSLVAGFVLLTGITYAIQDYDKVLTTSTGVPPVQIFLDATGQVGGILLLLIAIGFSC